MSILATGFAMHRATLSVVTFVLFFPDLSGAEPQKASQLLPRTTVLYAELPDPLELISAIFDHPLRQKIEALEPYKQAIRTEQYRAFLTGRKFVEIQVGMEWREALETLTAQGVFFGVDAETQGVAMLIHAKDAESLELFRTKLLELTKLGKNPNQVREADYRGVTAYEVNKARFAVVEDWLLITNNPETGKAVLDRLLDGQGDCLADDETFQLATSSRPADASGWAFGNLKLLREAGIAAKLFEGRSGNPAVELLVGGILSTLQQTPFATAGIVASPEAFSLQLSVPHDAEWVPEEREFYFGPDGLGRAPALPQAAETLFTLSAYRDVSEMWIRAGDLFNEQINDGFAEADASLTTLFAGKDFGEDILGSLTPEIGFIATRQNFADVLPVPAIKLPQFALVVQLKDPESMTRELRRTFQSMVGFFNVLGAMEGRPQLEMNMEKLDSGAELITSVYVPEADDAESTQADILFNFAPSVGFANERFVVASTDRLARELVQSDTMTNIEPDANTDVRLQLPVLKQVLDDNRDQLISQNMLEEGHSREEAEAAIGLLLEVVGYFREASIRLDAAGNQLAVKFQVRVKQD
ncbi:MAG: hypothetical protein RIK87_30380 [Fuerstiella sp.]